MTSPNEVTHLTIIPVTIVYTPQLQKHPSFSTTLLDEIYRSIDGFEEKQAAEEDFEAHRRRHRNGGGGRHGCPKVTMKNVRIVEHNVDEDEDVVSFRRACLVEKWMEQKVSDKVKGTKPPLPPLMSDFDNDPLFFSSSSSDSSSGVLSSSSSLSDTEFLESTRKSSASLRTSCFNSSRPKPVRTTVEKSSKTEHENLIKSKSAAVKMYANLKKMKQPISPGARLTNFLNSLFANGKPKSAVKPSPEYPKPPPPQPSTSAASRSCLNKTPRINNGVKRTVRFNPVGVIVDEDCRPCGHKRIYDRDYPAGEPEFQEIKKTQGVSRGIALRGGYHQWKKDFYAKEEEEEDDKLSDCSSDLFEIDHLASFAGNRRFREELPVYETTQLPASAFIR
nr:protein BIG GRAIN 1-like B [Ipomoea batatas]